MSTWRSWTTQSARPPLGGGDRKGGRSCRDVDLSGLCCARKIDVDRAYGSFGTLGGGNHFIEANRDDDGNVYVVVHSGSRNLGREVATFYQEAAHGALTARHISVPKPLAYVDGGLLEQYLHDMRIAQRFASLNRQVMIDAIVEEMGFRVAERFTTIHNYIDMDNMILRKGAVSAQKGERLLIPINMRDGSLVCVGKGNEDWNFSAPHGAGRLMKRSDAKQAFTVEEYRKEMEGVYSTSVGRGTLDECPMAYKKMADIVDNVEPSVAIEAVIKPIYNFKAGGEE